MFAALKNHPFAVEAFFESSFVLTFAVPKIQLQPLIPECLELDILNDTWAFIAVAMVQTKKLRPKGFPAFLGNDFFLAGYRVFVKYTNHMGKRRRGLYILKSETNKKHMAALGNIFTHYHYTTIDISQTRNALRTTLKSRQSGMDIVVEQPEEDIPLPSGSPFADWKEARKFAGPLPFTFTYDAQRQTVLIIEGVRQHWIPRPLRIIHYHIPFLDTLNLPGMVLANAFYIHNIPYYWKKGKIEIWKR